VLVATLIYINYEALFGNIKFRSEPRKEKVKKRGGKRNGTSRIKQAVPYSGVIDQSGELL
jgi:hypothetical protein